MSAAVLGGAAAAAAAPFLDRSFPPRRDVDGVPGRHPGIARRRPPPLLLASASAAAARRRPVRHASPRSLAPSPPAAPAGLQPQRCHVAGTTRAYKATGLHSLLNNEANHHDFDSKRSVSPFSTAGFFSKMLFWWMNPLIKKGYEKPLEETDIPALGIEDEAGTQYSMFMNKIDASKSSLFWIIVSCYKREILVSGFFALLKVLTLSAGPLFLKEFINVSSGKEAFKHEGFVIVLGLLFSKCLESLAQRQWYFRTRRVGVQVRSLLSAAIYRKQQKLSCSASTEHSSGEIMNYLMVDTYRIGEFPFWFHRTWTTGLQLCIALMVLYNAVGPATVASVFVIVLTVMLNAPLAKQLQNIQSKLMEAQDMRLKTMSESLTNMKVLKLYAWENHFKGVIEQLRELELKWLSAFQLGKAYTSVLFWASPALVSAATFLACYFLGVPLDPSNVFTFVAALRLVQDPINHIPNVIGSVIQARAAFNRLNEFLGASELQKDQVSMEYSAHSQYPIAIKSGCFSWDSSENYNLRNINLMVKSGTKVAICGEVGSGKSSLLAAILGEVPRTDGVIQVSGKIAYVSQNAWIQTGSVKDNILFGSTMDKPRYEETLKFCSLVHDLEILPFGDLTQIGERGANLSGGQKQRIQLARALYHDADIYLLDDPFSSVDAHTATSLFNEYVMGALSEKTVLLVTHQVEFLHAFDSVLLMSQGQIMHAASYQELLLSSREFQNLVNAHKDIVNFPNDNMVDYNGDKSPFKRETAVVLDGGKESIKNAEFDQLIRREEREIGGTGLKPYLMYLGQNKGYIYATLVAIANIAFTSGQLAQNSWLAANIQNPGVSTFNLVQVYTAIGIGSIMFLLFRALLAVDLGLQTSRSLFSQLLTALFRAPMSFFHSTPIGRILSRVSSDLNVIDLDVPFTLSFSISATLNAYINLGVLCFFTWPILFIAAPIIIMAVRLQRYYSASSKELMRINGTTKSLVANHLAESISGAVTVRAFKQEGRFFARFLELIDNNASPSFHCFAATEWLTQRLEIMATTILSSSAFVITLLPQGTLSPGVAGMVLSYGLSLNMLFLFSIQNQCSLANQIISVERISQYMDIVSEAPDIVEDNQLPVDWPSIGSIVLEDLEVKYTQDASPVLKGISCTFQGGDKIGIVGRTGSGKTTLINAIFRLVEPSGGKITIDGQDITTMGLHDLRSRIGLIPQDPILFNGSIRYNLDPHGHFSDKQIWEVLGKCQLDEVINEKKGLDSLVVEGGSNWSMGQRQLLCLGRALLRRSRILILDEATASMDNATDAVIQKTVRTELKDSTIITIAHRIPTVMDCTRVLVVNDGEMVEYEEPQKLMQTEGSFFKELLNEYRLQISRAGLQISS
ncbi:ABC transporter C family member 10 [Oryza sativa Japonica Group]|uniref:ABC transporter C family member 10 n=1 Tax=Oryza sativa subsp. japonica TaxID=39947 RepID=UPI00077539CC|nr:ABC transporter C family member 10 isoform X1 [Oryza sativa Japonica Group]XP_015618698.1 ABC transporter C family member 10 isoform X1 [Oryza sativa Japonica Group]